MNEPEAVASHHASLHAVVRGRVQGVGFRDFVRRRARSLGVHGTVRNLAGGEVELIAEGERARLEALLAAAHEGPPGSRVEGVETTWGRASGAFHGFEIDF